MVNHCCSTSFQVSIPLKHYSMVIFMMILFRCISRLTLLFQHDSNIIENPPIPILKRNTINQVQTRGDFNVDARTQLDSIAFVLKRSGKVIRKIESSPPLNLRNWKPLSIPNCTENVEPKIHQKLAARQLVAEMLYALKPLIHLSSIYRFGNNTWKPWALSLLIDLASLQIHKSAKYPNIIKLTPRQQLQLSRRYFSLLLYLLRSPFYDRHTRDRLMSFLRGCSEKLPLVGLICSPLAHYIPHWQQTYFYMWST